LDTSDYVSIIEVESSYARALDSRDWARLGECFDADATAEYSAFARPMNGRDEIVSAIREGCRKFEVTQHIVGSPSVRIDGHTAVGSFYVIAQHVARRDGAEVHCLVGVDYADELSLNGASWRIVRRKTNRLWTQGDESILSIGSSR